MSEKYILKNESTGVEQTYDTIIDIVKFFKTTEKYKIPNFLKERVKEGESILITTPSGKYLIYKK